MFVYVFKCSPSIFNPSAKAFDHIDVGLIIDKFIFFMIESKVFFNKSSLLAHYGLSTDQVVKSTFSK